MRRRQMLISNIEHSEKSSTLVFFLTDRNLVLVSLYSLFALLEVPNKQLYQKMTLKQSIMLAHSGGSSLAIRATKSLLQDNIIEIHSLYLVVIQFTFRRDKKQQRP